MSQAASYTAQKMVVDGTDVVRLTDAARATEVSIALAMGNNSYEMKVNGTNAFWMPFTNLAEWRAKPSFAGNPFLAPWANRLGEDAFHANGKKYLINRGLGNIRPDNNGKAIHGLLMYSSAWKLASLEADPAAIFEPSGEHAPAPIRSMQRKSVGQLGFKQGLHGTARWMTMLLSPTGEVVAGFVEPKIATVGSPSAPAMCIKPESFERKSLQRTIRAMASFRSVFPARSIRE